MCPTCFVDHLFLKEEKQLWIIYMAEMSKEYGQIYLIPLKQILENLKIIGEILANVRPYCRDRITNLCISLYWICLRCLFTLHHGKSPSNYHLGIYFFPSILCKYRLPWKNLAKRETTHKFRWMRCKLYYFSTTSALKNALGFWLWSFKHRRHQKILSLPKGAPSQLWMYEIGAPIHPGFIM